jgi:hypothetical protein
MIASLGHILPCFHLAQTFMRTIGLILTDVQLFGLKQLKDSRITLFLHGYLGILRGFSDQIAAVWNFYCEAFLFLRTRPPSSYARPQAIIVSIKLSVLFHRVPLMGPTLWKASFLVLSIVLVQSRIIQSYNDIQSDSWSSLQDVGTSESRPLQTRDSPPWNPNNQVRCIGDVPLEWRALFIQDTESVTESTADSQAEYDFPRQLCAVPTYGGNPVWNIGASCAVIQQDALFLISNPSGSQVSHSLRMDITEFCRLRCRCVYQGVFLGPERPARGVTDSEATVPSPYDLNPGNGGDGFDVHRALQGIFYALEPQTPIGRARTQEPKLGFYQLLISIEALDALGRLQIGNCLDHLLIQMVQCFSTGGKLHTRF